MRGAAIITVGVLLTLALGCGLYSAGIAARVVPAPAFNLNFGAFRVVSFTTNTESCARRLLCPTDHIRTRVRSFYAIWLVHNARPGAARPFDSGRPLLVLLQRDNARR